MTAHGAYGEIEINGPGAHDGMRLDVPEDVVALVVITERDGEYTATWSQRRSVYVDEQECADALRYLLITAGWPL